jgi:hypothetical protein
VNLEVQKLHDEQLRNLIQNHRTKGATSAPRYIEALGELARRHDHGLSFETTMQIVRSAARQRKFLSYKELADPSGVDFNKARYAINDHLWQLVEYAHRRGWPLMSAIIVNKSNVHTGDIEPSTRKGFISAAHDLGYTVTDEHAFLREQQARVFELAEARGSDK